MKLLVVGDSLFEKLENIFKRQYGVPNWTFEVHAGKEPLRLGCAKQRRLDYDAVVYVSAGNAMYSTDLEGMWKKHRLDDAAGRYLCGTGGACRVVE